MTIFETISYDYGIREAVAEDVAAMVDQLDDRLSTLAPEGIVCWVEKNINLELDTTTADAIEGGGLRLAPYQREAVAAQDMSGVFEVVISGPEQMGKSLCWKAGCTFKMAYQKGPKLIVYEDRIKAGEINRKTFHPLVTGVPTLARQIESRGWTARKNYYDLEKCNVEFTGAGAAITSNPERDVFADERDTWPLTYSKNIAQGENLRKRLRRWKNAGLGCLTQCSSIKGTEDNSPIWYELRQTDMGIWHLRCLHCGEAVINSTVVDGRRDPARGVFIGGLQFESEKHQPVEDSIRLQCPVCEHLHTCEDTFAMNDHGVYVPQQPEVIDRRGFLFGGLSSFLQENGTWFGLSWPDIARARCVAKQSNDYEVVRTYHNSFRGMPMPQLKIDDDRTSVILTHCAPLPADVDILAVAGSADTQESPWGWYWIIRGIDAHWNTYLLASGFAHTKQQLEDMLLKTYCGKKLSLAIIDQGGTNAEDVKALARKHRFIWQYKGASRPSGIWVRSKSREQIKLILCDADRLQLMLIRQIYEQTDRSNNYWFLPPPDQLPCSDDAGMDYITNIQNVRDMAAEDEVEKGKDHNPADPKHFRQNWTCGSHERRDFFDCEKMMLVLLGMPRLRQQLENVINKKGPMVLSEIQRGKN